MDSYEGEQIDDEHVNHMYQWNTGGVCEAAFGPIALPLIETRAHRPACPLPSIVDPSQDVQILSMTVPAQWFDHAAERFCDLTHAKRVYMTRARIYTNTTSKSNSSVSDNTTRIYIFQFFFQLISILWRWKDTNDDLPWASGITPTGSDSEISDDDGSSDEESLMRKPGKRKKKEKSTPKERTAKRKRTLSQNSESISGTIRSECSLLIDWRWRPMCDKCRALRRANLWGVFFCDHVKEPGDMMPVLDYTFWFLVRGWGRDVWTRRVGYAAIAAVKRLHTTNNENRNTWVEPGDGDVDESQGAAADEPKWNARKRDGSDMWKNIQCADHFVKAAKIYLQSMNYSRAQITALLPSNSEQHPNTPSIRNLVGVWNPFKVYSVEATFNYLGKNNNDLLRSVLLEASCMEIKYSDISNWPQFWRRFLPHYDFLCVRGLETAFPGVYHRDMERFHYAQMSKDASHSIKFISAFQSDVRSLPPIHSNSDRTKIWQLADENAEAVRDGKEKLFYEFMQRHNDLFTEDEQMITASVWNYIRRKRAFIKYVLQCRSAESHLSHALVCLWDEYGCNNGSVYNPASIRPPNYGPGIPNPWEFYFHNLSPFGNFSVNRAYQLWRYFNVDPPHVKYACLLIDSANNATRGELHNVGLNPMIYSSEGGTGKSFIKDDVLAKTRAGGTTTVVSHRSGAVQNIQRLGTHDDMVLLQDEIKQRTFVNKDEGGMADPKVKELMSAGETQSQVMASNPGGRGPNDRDIKTYLYRELCTVVATGNLNIMKIKDVAFLSRWLLLPLNVQYNNSVKRPREPPNPPAYVVAQMHQIQYAISEIHKMVQVGAMDVEDTYVVTIMLDALKDEFSKYGNNTQRKEMQVRSLARIHAITDLVVTHFWTPGGLFYNTVISPSRLAALNDFLMVRMEHVIFALGQIDDLLTLTDEHLIKLAITYMWRRPNSTFTVCWDGINEDTPLNCYDVQEGRAGFISSLQRNTYDIVEFRGRSLSFLKQFSSCIRHIICNEVMKESSVGANIPTEEQIGSQLEQWCTRIWKSKRAVLGNPAKSLVCSPDDITFSDESLPAEPMCRTTIQNGELCIRFPVHMLLSSEPQPSLAETPKLKEMIAFSVEYTASKITRLSGKSKKRNDVTRTFVVGREIPNRPEYFNVMQFPPNTANFPNVNEKSADASTASNSLIMRPKIPYRFYEDIMDSEEYEKLAGNTPPVSREELVPMLFSLDEFAARSRVTQLGHEVGAVTNSELGMVLSKLVLADFARMSNSQDLKAIMRPTMMFWGNIYQKPSAEIYNTMSSMQDNMSTDTASAHNVLCDYQEQKFAKKLVDEENIREAISHDHFILRRTRYVERIMIQPCCKHNSYKRTADAPDGNNYPALTPSISQNNTGRNLSSTTGFGKRKCRRKPKVPAAPSQSSKTTSYSSNIRALGDDYHCSNAPASAM